MRDNYKRVLRRPLTHKELEAALGGYPAYVSRFLDTNKGEVRSVVIAGRKIHFYPGWLDALQHKRPQDLFLHYQIVLQVWIDSSPSTPTFESLGKTVRQLRNLATKSGEQADYFEEIWDKLAREPEIKYEIPEQRETAATD